MATSPDDDGAADDPFSPFHDVTDAESDPEARLITARAVILGGLSGALVNAANIYLGLKTGWTSSANILGVGSIFNATLHLPHFFSTFSFLFEKLFDSN